MSQVVSAPFLVRVIDNYNTETLQAQWFTHCILLVYIALGIEYKVLIDVDCVWRRWRKREERERGRGGGGGGGRGRISNILNWSIPLLSLCPSKGERTCFLTSSTLCTRKVYLHSSSKMCTGYNNSFHVPVSFGPRQLIMCVNRCLTRQTPSLSLPDMFKCMSSQPSWETGWNLQTICFPNSSAETLTAVSWVVDRVYAL